MKLHQLPKSKGIKRKSRRRGVGPGSGLGKTSGKGHKGQKSRSGGGIPLTFEGGQMPLARILPYKRGRKFSNFKFKKHFTILNLNDLEKLPESLSTVNQQTLIEAGVLSNSDAPLKVLGNGKITRALNVTAACSESAKSAIEAAGGSVAVPAEKATSPQSID